MFTLPLSDLCNLLLWFAYQYHHRQPYITPVGNMKPSSSPLSPLFPDFFVEPRPISLTSARSSSFVRWTSRHFKNNNNNYLGKGLCLAYRTCRVTWKTRHDLHVAGGGGRGWRQLSSKRERATRQTSEHTCFYVIPGIKLGMCSPETRSREKTHF